MLQTMIAVLVFLFGYSALVVTGEGTVVVITNATVTLYPNEYVAEWTCDLETPPNESTMITLAVKAIKDMPENLMVKSHVLVGKMVPMTSVELFCDVIETKIAEESMKSVNIPENRLPKSCPYPAGSWVFPGIKIPVNSVPQAIPDCQFSGTFLFYENIFTPMALIEFSGALSRT